MSQMPQIKAEVNKEPQKDKKKAGLLARLFGGGSGGGAMGTGGLGGAGGLAGGGGMLATKAGLMTLVLVGTTVAGGIGLVGYRIFGPGSEAGNGGDNLQLFAAKPKDAQPSEDPNAAPKDGSSQSLTFASQANTTPKAPEVAAAPAPADATAAGASSSASADAAAATSGGAINSAGSASSGVNKNLLKGSGKFGTLSSGVGGGGGSAASAGGSGGGSGAKTNTEALAAASRNGATSGMKKGLAATGGARMVAARKGANKPMGQAFAALKDGRGAQTSYAAGRTFDGSTAPGGMNAGPEGGAIGMGGPGTADGGAQPKSLPNNQGDKKEFKAPPTPTSKDAAPWQNAINEAQMMLALGGVLLFIASKIKIPWLYYAIAAVVAALGVAIIALGGQISGGEYGQKLQGGVLAAAGLGLTAAAVMAMVSDPPKDAGPTTSTSETKVDAAGNKTTVSSDGMGGSSTVVQNADGSGSSTSTAAAKDDGGLFGMNPYVLLGGGAALVGIATCQLKPPEKHPSKDFENGNPPDNHWFGYQSFPSENAVKKMIA